MRILFTLPWDQLLMSIIMVMEFHLPHLQWGFLSLQNLPQTHILMPPHVPQVFQEAQVIIVTLFTQTEYQGQIPIIMVVEFIPHHLQLFLALWSLPQIQSWILTLVTQFCHWLITNRLVECLLPIILLLDPRNKSKLKKFGSFTITSATAKMSNSYPTSLCTYKSHLKEHMNLVDSKLNE